VQVVIASADKDFMQLVSDRVGLMNPSDAGASIWTAAEVRAKMGIEPSQVVDWLSLIGDSVDNIPGVPGIGPKNATKLIKCFGSVAGIYARLSQVQSESLRTRLAAAAEVVERNQRLIRLKDDLPWSLPLETLAVRAGDPGRLRELYAEWGFNSLLQELESPTLRQGNLF
jgi:DNA polymerase-1